MEETREQRQLRQIQKKKKRRQGWITFGLVALLLFYGGYQLYRSVFATIQTEQAAAYSVYESIDAQGLVFRSETVIPPTDTGTVYYTIENGTRVAKGGVIARVYASEHDGVNEQRIEALDTQIAALKAIQADRSSSHLNLNMINTQINSAVAELVQQVDGYSMDAGADGMHARLLSALSKKQIVTGGNVDLSTTITRLEQEKQELAASYKQALRTVTAPVAGYFADETDGYEAMLAHVEPTELTAAQLQEYLESDAPAPQSSSGKIVSGYEWYFACFVPDSYYNTLSVGKELSLRMSFVTDEEIPVTVAAGSRAENGRMAVVFRCAYMSESLSTIRKENVQILLVKHTGLKVPKRAIVIDDTMQAGVYIRYGNIVSFRKIDQIYSEPADYVICKETDEKGYLHIYDDIIVGGRGLYDGKIIR